MEGYELNGRRLHIFGSDNAEVCIICGMGNHEENEAADTAKLLYERTAPDTGRLVVFETDDWNADFSPWQSKPLFGDEPFSGKAPKTLNWVKTSLVPFLHEKGICVPNGRIYIVGYSLSGLFALWAFLESDVFDGAASCSGSLWFPRWLEYIGNRKRRRNGIVYLSLGSKEDKTKNIVMAAVGNNTRETYRTLKSSPDISKITLERNNGGHFANPKERLVKGMLWLIGHTDKGEII